MISNTSHIHISSNQIRSQVVLLLLSFRMCIGTVSPRSEYFHFDRISLVNFAGFLKHLLVFLSCSHFHSLCLYFTGQSVSSHVTVYAVSMDAVHFLPVTQNICLCIIFTFASAVFQTWFFFDVNFPVMLCVMPVFWCAGCEPHSVFNVSVKNTMKH